MELIYSKSEFQNVLDNSKKSIIFCFHGWSEYSMNSRKIVEEWETNSNRKIFIIDMTNMGYENHFHEWLANKEKGDWSKEGIMTKIAIVQEKELMVTEKSVR